MSPWVCGARFALLQNSVGRRTNAPKLMGKHRRQICLAYYEAFVLGPAKFWTTCSAPRKVLEQCKPCLANSCRQSFRGQNKHTNFLKSRYSYFLEEFIFKPLSFQRTYYFESTIQPYGVIFRPQVEEKKCELPVETTQHLWTVPFCLFLQQTWDGQNWARYAKGMSESC